MSTGSEGRLTRRESQGIHMGLLHDWKLPEGFCILRKQFTLLFFEAPALHITHTISLGFLGLGPPKATQRTL